MDGSVVHAYLSNVLHTVSQALLAPDIILLLAFIAYALFCIGSIIAECVSERRHFKVTMPQFLADLMAAKEDEIPAVIEQSGLLKRQKMALLTVYDYRMLPGDAMVALIKRLVNEEESRYDRIAGRNNMAARVSPMLGLMGTLIPLGPGIQALGQADTATLSSSLLVAFDTTVAGLVVAAVCLVVGKIRGNWYSNYMSALDSAMATMLQKIEDMRAEGKIQITEPSDYAFLYGAKSDKKNKDKAPDAEAGTVEQTGAQDAPATSSPALGSSSYQPSGSQTPERTVQTTPSGMPVYESRTSGYRDTDSPSFARESLSFQPPAQSQNTYAPSTQQTGPLPQIDASSTTPIPPASSYAAPDAGTSYAPQAQRLDTAIPSFDPSLTGQVASPRATAGSGMRVAAPIQEVPMPSFLDALAANAPEPQQTPSSQDDQPAARPVSQSWYQPQRSDYSSSSNMPLWGTGQTGNRANGDDRFDR